MKYMDRDRFEMWLQDEIEHAKNKFYNQREDILCEILAKVQSNLFDWNGGDI